MDNFKLRPSELFNKKRKLDELSAHRHCKVVQIGSGESGYSSFSLLSRVGHFQREETMAITESPIHRPRHGQLYYALHNYERIDFEVPYIKSFMNDEVVFDRVVELDLDKKKLVFMGNEFVTYDYLMLNCGREVDTTGLEALMDRIDVKDNFYYTVDDFNSLEKMREDFEYFHNGVVFNLVAQKSADGCLQLLSLAFLLRHLYDKAEINVYFEAERLSPSDAVNAKIIEQLGRNDIRVALGSKLVLEGDSDNLSVKINGATEITDDIVIFSFNKKTPEFLTQASLSIEEFNLETLQHRQHPSLFASGSLVYPNSTLGQKYSQARVQIENFNRAVGNEWYGRSVELLKYKHEHDVIIHKTFDHISKIYEATGKSDGLLKAKLRSLRHLNTDLFKYMYVLPRGWGLKRLFR